MRTFRTASVSVFVSAFAGVSTLLAAASAQAQVHMAATAGNLRYTVTDLAPDDGIAATASFTTPAQAKLWNNLSVIHEGLPELRWAGEPVVTSPTVINRDWSSAVHTGIAWDGSTLVAAGQIAPVAAGNIAFEEWAYTPWQNFTLTPHTRVTLSVDAALDFTLDGGPGTQADGWGEAWLELNHSINNGAFGQSSPMDDGINGNLGDNFYTGFSRAVQTGRTLTVTWDNTGDYVEQGFLTYDARVVGRAWGTPVEPVPEPGEWAMLALGCAWLVLRGRAARRGRRGVRLLALAATFGLLGIGAPAQAQNRSAAVADNFAYTLTDLAPDDGVAPSAVFTSPVDAWLHETLEIGHDWQPVQRWAYDERVTGPAAATQNLSYVHGSAGYLGNGTTAAAVITPQQGAAIQAYQRASVDQDFSLAPHTAITFTIDLGLDLAIDPHSTQRQQVSGSAMLYVEGEHYFARQEWLLNSVSNDPYFAALGYATAAQKFEAATITWQNDTDGWLNGDVGYDTYVIASTNDGGVTPVPEPAGRAMLGAGLGLLGWRARRRATHAG